MSGTDTLAFPLSRMVGVLVGVACCFLVSVLLLPTTASHQAGQALCLGSGNCHAVPWNQARLHHALHLLLRCTSQTAFALCLPAGAASCFRTCLSVGILLARHRCQHRMVMSAHDVCTRGCAI